MIVPMVKVLLVSRARDRSNVLLALRRLGAVHLEPVEPEKTRAPADLAQQLSRCQHALTALGKVPATQETSSGSALSSTDVMEQVEACLHLNQVCTETLATLAKERQAVQPWGPWDAEALRMLETDGFSIGFWKMPADQVTALPAHVAAVVCSQSGKQAWVFTVSREPFTPPQAVAMPRPARDVRAVDADMEKQRQQREETTRALTQLAAHRSVLVRHLRDLEVQREFALAELGTLNDGALVGLTGWLPKPQQSEMERWLQSQPFPVTASIRDATEDEEPPTLTNPPWFARPIHALFDILGTVPGYREFDVGAAFMISLAVFVAMLVGDAGYGLVVALPLLVMYRQAVAKLGERTVQLVLVLCAATVAYGGVTATFFGASFGMPRVLDLKERDMQVVCFTIGAIHISVAHLWRAARKFPRWSTFSELGWIAATWSIWSLVLLLVVERPLDAWVQPALITGVLAALLLEQPSWNILRTAARGLINVVMSTISLFSDIISYIRLMAVGLAGMVLAQSFNEFAASASPALVVPILLVGHALNIMLCIIAIFAHGVRLNMLEFGNHLGMAWVGRRFHPFSEKGDVQ